MHKPYPAVLLLLALLPLTGAIAEVRYISATGFALSNAIQVNTDTETTWRAFIEQVDLWWPSDHTWWGEAATLSIEPFAGGCFCEKHGASSAEHMRVTFVDPQRALRMVGGLGPLQGMGMSGTLEFVFTENNAGTAVTMNYTVNGFSPDGLEGFVPIVDQVQGLQIGGLKTLLDGSNQ